MDNNALRTLEPGQHACCFYQAGVQVVTTATALSRALPGRPELHLFFAAGEMEDHLLSLLRAGFEADRAGTGYPGAQGVGQAGHSGWGRKLVVFPGPITGGPEQIIRKIDGYVSEHGSGTAVHLGIMATGLAAAYPADRWFWHLGAFNSYLQQKKISCLSFYLESSFPPEFVFQCLRVHPLSIAEQTALTNPHWIPAASLAAALGLEAGAAERDKNRASPLLLTPDQEALPQARTTGTADYDLAAITPAPVLHTDARGLITYVNAFATALLHSQATSLTGLPYAQLLHPSDRARAGKWLTQVMAGRKVPPLEVRVHPERGTARVRSVAGRLEQGSQIVWEDLSLRDRLETANMLNERLSELCDQLKKQTVRDVLTGVYNRQYFDEELARFRNPRQWPVSVLLIDVDGLKQVNDTCGHARGDLVLKKAAEAIRAPFREGDVIARIGGDEFAVVLPRTGLKAALARKEDILKEAAAISSRDGLGLSLSIGVATGAGPEPGMEELVGLADMDMYRVKENTRQKHPGA